MAFNTLIFVGGGVRAARNFCAFKSEAHMDSCQLWMRCEPERNRRQAVSASVQSLATRKLGTELGLELELV